MNLYYRQNDNFSHADPQLPSNSQMRKKNYMWLISCDIWMRIFGVKSFIKRVWWWGHWTISHTILNLNESILVFCRSRNKIAVRRQSKSAYGTSGRQNICRSIFFARIGSTIEETLSVSRAEVKRFTTKSFLGGRVRALQVILRRVRCVRYIVLSFCCRCLYRHGWQFYYVAHIFIYIE